MSRGRDAAQLPRSIAARMAALGKRVLLMSAALAFALLTAEAATRAFSSVERPLDAPDAVVGKTYLPGYSGTVYVEECDCDVFLRFNREGFRGPDLPYDKPPGVRRVAVIGDSMVAAIATPEDLTLGRRLEALLDGGRNDSMRWEVMNFGVSGSGTAQELVLYRERVRRYHPDVVVLGFFLRNDVVDNSPRLGTNPRIYFDLDERGTALELPFSEARARESSWLNRHSRFYVWQKVMFARARDRWGRLDRSRLVYVGDPDEDLRHAWKLTAALVREFRAEVERDGSRFLLAALPPAELVYDDVWAELRARSGQTGSRFRRELPEQRMREVCSEAGVTFIDLTAAFRAAAPHASSKLEGEQLYFQGIGHFNARGNEIAAHAIAEEIVRTRP